MYYIVDIDIQEIVSRVDTCDDAVRESYDGTNTDCIAGDEVKGALLWPLSTKEAYDLDGNLRRLDEGTGRNWAIDYWWLRSPGDNSFSAALVGGGGYVNDNGDYVSDSTVCAPLLITL